MKGITVKFDNISSSYEDLTPEEREKAADLIESRNDLALKMFELNRMRVQVLRNYTPEGEQALANFTSTMIAPLRAHASTQKAALLQDAVNVEGLKSLLPMIAMGLLQNINIPLLLTATDVDPDVINEMMAMAKKFIKDGL